MAAIATVFAITVLYCIGPDTTAAKCTIKKIEPPHFIDKATCLEVGKAFGDQLVERHPSARVLGTKCWTIPDFMDNGP